MVRQPLDTTHASGAATILFVTILSNHARNQGFERFPRGSPLRDQLDAGTIRALDSLCAPGPTPRIPLLRAIVAIRCLSILMLIVGLLGGAALAQSPPPLPQPNLALNTVGVVNAWVRQPDGGYVLGGVFSSINGEMRSNLARLLPDGSLDPNWKPSADGVVHALAVDEVSGAIYVGGDFTRIGTIARARIARLSGTGDGAPDADWSPSANGRVSSLAIDADSGAIFVGGTFSTIGGQSRGALAKLQPGGTGLADPNWNPSPGFYPDELVVDRGAVFVVGIIAFMPVAKSFAKFDANGTGTPFAGWNPSATGSVYSMTVHKGTGDIYIGGNGVLRRLSSQTGAITANWTLPGFGPTHVTVLALNNQGNVIYAGGTYRLRRLSTSGVVDANWSPSFSGALRALALGDNGSVYVGGQFSLVGDETRLSAVAIDASGNVGAPIDAEQPSYANVLAVQPTGGVIVGGPFLRADGFARLGLLRLAADGSLDPDWNPSPGSGNVWALAIGENGGDVYVGGEFSNIGGQPRNNLAKLSGSGSGAADPLWNPSPGDLVTSLAVDDSGAVFVGGLFSPYEGGPQYSIGGQTNKYLAKLSGTGTGGADPDWRPEPNSAVDALAIDADGSVYVGGQFSAIGGEARAYIAKVAVSGAGAADADWDPSADARVHGLTLDGQGAIYASGFFTTVGGLSRSHLAKVSASGSGAVDTNWNPSPNGRVHGLAIAQDGSLYVGGGFTTIGGQPRSYLARLSSTGTGAVDPRWNPVAGDYGLATLVLDANQTVYVGGTLTSIGGQVRHGLAAIASILFSDGFEEPLP